MGAVVVITTISALPNSSTSHRQTQWNRRPPKHTSSPQPQKQSLPTSLHSHTHPCSPTPIISTTNPPSSLDHYSSLASNLDGFVKVSDQVSATVVGDLRSGRGLRKVVEFVTEGEKVGIRGVGLFDRAAMEALRRECRRVIGRFREGKEVVEFVEAMETLSGCSVEDDMVIITGVERDASGTSSLELEVQQAITRVLQNEPGLDVLIGPGSVPLENNTGRITKSETENTLNIKGSLVSTETDSLARRPEEFGMLKITQTSLRHWLQKKSRH